jgi:hypothetical protein
VKLEDLQTTAKALIEAITEIASANIPVIVDDGSYPRLSEREAALAAPGVVIIVFPPQAKSIDGEISRSGVAKFHVGLHVAVEENKAANVTGLDVQKVMRLVMDNVSGKPATPPPGLGFIGDSPPFVTFPTTDGLRQGLVAFTTICFINPT